MKNIQHNWKLNNTNKKCYDANKNKNYAIQTEDKLYK